VIYIFLSQLLFVTYCESGPAGDFAMPRQWLRSYMLASFDSSNSVATLWQRDQAMSTTPHCLFDDTVAVSWGSATVKNGHRQWLDIALSLPEFGNGNPIARAVQWPA
jgi:hypothetical protein